MKNLKLLIFVEITFIDLDLELKKEGFQSKKLSNYYLKK